VKKVQQPSIQTLADMTMEMYNTSINGDKHYPDTEVYYRPFVYGSRPKGWQWGRKIGLSRAVLKAKLAFFDFLR